MFELSTFLLIIYLSAVLGNNSTQIMTDHDETRLIRKLFHTDVYDPEVRPVVNANHQTTVIITLQMLQLQDVNTQGQYITIIGFLSAGWKDERIAWDPSDYNGLSYLFVPPTKVWLPTFILSNSASSVSYEEEWYTRFKVRLTHDGNVYWSRSSQFTSYCSIDITYFPFDEQICELIFENWSYYGFLVNLTYGKEAMDLFDRFYIVKNEEWEFKGVKVYRNDTAYFSKITFPKVYFRMQLKRKPLFYVSNFLLQTILLSALVLSIFKLPAESGERLSMGVTLFLAFTVVLSTIEGYIPVSSSSVPLMSIYLIAIMVVTTIAICESVIILYLFAQKATHRPPCWLRYLITHILEPCTCNRNKICRLSDTNETVENVENKRKSFLSVGEENGIKKDLNNSAHCDGDTNTPTSAPVGNGHLETNFEEWRHIARVIDRFCFWLFLTLFTLVIFILLIIIPNGYHGRSL